MIYTNVWQPYNIIFVTRQASFLNGGEQFLIILTKQKQQRYSVKLHYYFLLYQHAVWSEIETRCQPLFIILFIIIYRREFR